MRSLLVCLAVFGFAAPAAACLNDVESPSHEREFRSQYGGNHDTPPPSSEPTNRPSLGLLLGAGLVALLGAAAITVSAGRVRR